MHDFYKRFDSVKNSVSLIEADVMQEICEKEEEISRLRKYVAMQNRKINNHEVNMVGAFLFGVVFILSVMWIFE